MFCRQKQVKNAESQNYIDNIEISKFPSFVSLMLQVSRNLGLL